MPNEANRHDVAQALIRAGVSLVPGGGAINELLNLVIVPAAAERQQRWLEALDHDLSRFRERVEGFAFETLQQREDFTSSFFRAWRIAATTHREEKLEALRNAVLNVAIGKVPDDDTQALFFSLIDAYTPWHLRILAFLNDPEQWTRAHERGAFRELPRKARSIGDMSFTQCAEGVFPELHGHTNLCQRVERDLDWDGLVHRAPTGVRRFTESVQRMLNGISLEGWVTEVLTDHGRSFLRFVSEPHRASTSECQGARQSSSADS